MAVSPRVTKVVQANLDRAKGIGDGLLTDPSAQAENLLRQGSNALNSGIKVIEGFKDSVEDIFSGSTIDVADKIGLSAPSFEQAAEVITQTALNPNLILGSTDNVLKKYASYNYNITLACLTVNELNFPDSTYRVKAPQVTVLRSGGGAPGKALTAYETSDAQLEYYIDEVKMNSVMAPTTATRTSNATTFSFVVQEPYSMGLFLQTLMIAALDAGHADYLKAPYALIIDFKGFDDDGNPYDTGPLGRRVFPIKINKMDFDVNAGGSAYNISAHAFNESALSNLAQHTKSDTKIAGDSVLELLQKGPNSLTSVMNKRIREKAEGEPAPINKDEYVIMFPKELTSSLGLANQTDSGTSDNAAMTLEEFYRKKTGLQNFGQLNSNAVKETEDDFNQYKELYITNNNVASAVRRIAESSALSNPIGTGTIAKSMVEGGNTPFGIEAYTKNANDTYESDNVTISNNFREFSFPQGTSVEQIIEEIVILSSYGKAAATEFTPDSDGMINWFRIHTQTFLVPDEAVRSVSGENPKVFVYAVVPYKVHSSVFNNATQPSVGIEKRKQQAAKVYDYIYTGKNDDILDFEINFNNSFYKALNTNINGSGDSRLSAKNASNAGQKENYNAASGNTEGGAFSNPNVADVAKASDTGGGGGAPLETPAVQVARMFNEAIVNNNVDMIVMDLTVLGDPYYLADSGVGNYSSPVAAKAYTADGSMDYQRAEVEVLVNFRTPIDYDGEKGTMIFPQDTIPVKAFSGLYKVNTVENSFSGGKFTQVLSMNRRPKQDDSPITGVSSDPGAVEGGENADAGKEEIANNSSSGGNGGG